MTTILIPPEVTDRIDRDEMAERYRRAEIEMAKRRIGILKIIAALKEESDKYEQTTHGCIFMPGEPSIGRVAEAIADAYDKPNSYNLGTLSQVLTAFIERKK